MTGGIHISGINMIIISNYQDSLDVSRYNISVSNIDLPGFINLDMLIPDIPYGDNSLNDKNRWIKKYMSQLNEINLDSILSLIDTYSKGREVTLITGDIDYVDYGDLLALWFTSQGIKVKKLHSNNRTESDWVSELGMTDKELVLNNICRDC